MGTVMVFSPAPQLTVTVEPSGEAAEIHLHAGGQGVWQARMIRALGAQAVLVAPLGGEVGRILKTLVAAEGITLRAVETSADNGAYLHDRRGGGRREIARAPARPLSRHDQDELYGLALTEGLRADVSSLGGSTRADLVPPDAYRRLAADLRRNSRTVVADLSGEYLTGVLAGGVDLIKVSHEELLRDGTATSDTVAALVSAMRRLRAAGAGTVVVSRAEKPALVLLADEVRQVYAPPLEPADPAGAGDSMLAGVAASLATGQGLETAIRTGVAAGALNVTRRGLGTGGIEMVGNLLDLVSLGDVATELAEPIEPTEPTEPEPELPVIGVQQLTPDRLAEQVRQACEH